MKTLILASGSPRRKELLQKAGIDFAVEVSNFDEYVDSSIPASNLAQKLSLGKAKKVAQNHIGEDVIILAADTIVVFGNEYLGKPTSYAEAVKMLTKLSGKTHTVVTGFVLIDAKSGKIVSDFDETAVSFTPFSDELITEYLDKNTYTDKAGSYAILELGNRYIDHIEGDINTVTGLPLEKVLKALQSL